MIDLFTWSTPNGRKISIALEEMDLDYTVRPINIGEDEQFAPEFLAIAPNNKIPAITDSDTGISLFESGAILLYLAEKTGRFLPSDAAARWATLQWLMWQMGGQGPILGQAHHFLKFNPGKAAYAEERFSKDALRLWGVLDTQLSDNAHVAGAELTVADFAIWPWASRFEWQQIDMAKFPNARRWYRELADRPGFRRGYDVPALGHEMPRV